MHIYANGLGPTSWGKWCILLPYRNRLNKAGIAHDIAYCLGTTEKDKEQADNEFLLNCIEESGTNIFAIFFSILYYIGVYCFGKYYFNYN